MQTNSGAAITKLALLVRTRFIYTISWCRQAANTSVTHYYLNMYYDTDHNHELAFIGGESDGGYINPIVWFYNKNNSKAVNVKNPDSVTRNFYAFVTYIVK